MGTLTSLRGQIPPDNLTAYRTSRGSGTHWPLHRQKQKSFPGNLQFDVNSKTIRTRYNDRMAASVNRYLVCFYCNVKSRRKQDGTVRQWECSHCDAMNYLDENGDITDPPVTTSEDTAHLSFAQAIPPPEWSTASSQDSVFCQTCIKNQHLSRSSLAQYLPDPNHPEYAILAKNLDKFKQELEDRYPQVCENCVERVQHRMKRAVYGAKVDAHGRMLERTRRVGKQGAKNKRSWMELAQDWGHIAWIWSIYAQLVCHALALGATFLSNSTNSTAEPISSNIEEVNWASHFLAVIVHTATSVALSILGIIVPILPRMAESGLVLNICTMWWNPQWRFTLKQNLHDVYGLRRWYTYRAILLGVECLLWWRSGYGMLDSAHDVLATGLHIVMIGCIVRTFGSATSAVVMKPKKLFASAPARETLISRRKSSKLSAKNPNSLMEALDSINDEPTIPSSPITPRTVTDYASPASHARWETTPRNRRHLSSTPTKLNGGRRMNSDTPLFSGMSPSTYRMAEALEESDPDEMEWTPSQSEHRAFNSGISAQREDQSFNGAPSGPEASAFWYKIPAAPMTPAQKLRNPPSQPVLNAPSAGAKENFFKKMTSDRPSSSASFGATKPRANYELAQPKFFPPGSTEDGTGLADAFDKAIRIDESEADKEQSAKGDEGCLCM